MLTGKQLLVLRRFGVLLNHAPMILMVLVIIWHTETSHKTGVFSDTTTRTSNLTSRCMFMFHHQNAGQNCNLR